MRRARALTVGILVGLAVEAPAALGQDVTVQTGATSAPVTRFFSPREVTVAPGSTVTVVNGPGGGGIAHDLVWNDGAPGFPTMGSFPYPINSAPWMSARTFTAPGEYPFYCSLHLAQQMTGVVHVVPPATPAPAPAPGPTAAPQPAAPGADATAPALTSATARATRRAVIVRLRVGEAARVTVVVATRTGRALARKRFTRRAAGRATLRVPVRARRGRLTVRITAVDAAGNTARTTLRVRVR